MSIEKDLKKDGITIISPIDTLTINSLAKYVSEQISSTYSSCGIKKDTLFRKISRMSMSYADIPEGFSEASYFYKNQTIYFKNGISEKDMKKYAIHECIHHIQEVRDDNNNLLKMGLADYTKRPKGIALNEAAVQTISSNILNNEKELVTYYGIDFETNSPYIYPILCNLLSQISFFIGEDTLIKSTFSGNDDFTNKMLEIFDKQNYKTILSNLDIILNTEEKIILNENKLLSDDLAINSSKTKKLAEKSRHYKEKIKETYFKTQELLMNSYFNYELSNISSKESGENFRTKLYQYKNYIGTYEGYTFYNEFYIDMMKKLDVKFENIGTSIYLVPTTDNKFIKILNAIKNFFKLKFNKELSE